MRASLLRNTFFAIAASTLLDQTTAFPSPLPVDGNNNKTSGTIWVTPHAIYSSSVGVLGCKVDTNRIAYWPAPVDCNNICVSLKYGSRSLHLLRIDQSGGAYDVSYDAWNELYTGHSAEDKPTAGGAIEMTYESETPEKCRDLIHTTGGKLPLSAANSMNFLASCLADEDSWVAKHHVLYNVLDPSCTMGRSEECALDWPAQNQPTCPHTLGVSDELHDMAVYNIEYPTGKKVRAGDSAGSRVIDDSCLGGIRWAMLVFFGMLWVL